MHSLITRLEDMTGIHGVSSSEWLPISQSASGNRKLSLGMIALSFNRSREHRGHRWLLAPDRRRHHMLHYLLHNGLAITGPHCNNDYFPSRDPGFKIFPIQYKSITRMPLPNGTYEKYERQKVIM